MSKTTIITLGASQHTIGKFNLGELEEIADLSAALAAHKIPFAILRIAVRRADPPIHDVNALEVSPEEFKEAIGKILELNALKQAGPLVQGAAALNPTVN